MADRLRCSHRHNLTVSEVVVCDAGHEHDRYVCPMRRGSRRCGQVVYVPSVAGNCTLDEDGDADRRPG